MLPFASAVVLKFPTQVFVWSSSTKISTVSPGCQPDPVRVTVAPGG
jgi:hypothetical protein